uniref:Replication protein A 70 kDa DNA-binding subunit-like n=1 Tax=Dermatophagoides pteronyssinus TaxID=6956 RepID=A0A6P6YAA3_DERPT|nr:replication protein A 70 kDa DNA-binding subunit-like [Dermatophagoides pteronyssinus]
MGQHYWSIENLNLASKGWILKAKVISISPLNSFQNKITNANGQYLNATLMDENGSQITAVFWNSAAIHVSSVLKIGETYTFSKGLVKVPNRRYSNASLCPFELVFNSLEKCDITPCTGEESIGADVSYTFHSIRSVIKSNNEYPFITNIKGIIHEVGKIRSVTTKDNEAMQVFTVTLVDASKHGIRINFWKPQYYEDMHVGEILKIVSCQIKENRQAIEGTFLNNSLIMKNLNEDDYQLIEWYKEHSSNLTIVNMETNFQSDYSAELVVSLNELIFLGFERYLQDSNRRQRG